MSNVLRWCRYAVGVVAVGFVMATNLLAEVAPERVDPLWPNSDERSRTAERRQVIVDILPGSDHNLVDLGLERSIAVAVLTTAGRIDEALGFDAAELDPATVAFGPDGASTPPGSDELIDIDGDGDLDLLVRFAIEATGLVCGDLEARLVAETYSGEKVVGSDGTLLIGCPRARGGIVDFEELDLMVGSQLIVAPGESLESGGFLFTPGPNDNSGFNDSHYGNAVLDWSYNGTHVAAYHDDVIMARADGSAFGLIAFDFAGWSDGSEIPFTVTADSGEVATFEPDGLADGPDGVEDFETFILPPSFESVSSVTWEHSGVGTNAGIFELDNIVSDAPCELQVLLGNREVEAGAPLELSLELAHHRRTTVTVPFAVWVETSDGNVIAGEVTQPMTFYFGDTARVDLEIKIPNDAGAGRHFLKVGIGEMQQGVAGVVEPFEVPD